jgi:hypothetical protein
MIIRNPYYILRSLFHSEPRPFILYALRWLSEPQAQYYGADLLPLLSHEKIEIIKTDNASES